MGGACVVYGLERRRSWRPVVGQGGRGSLVSTCMGIVRSFLFGGVEIGVSL